MKQPLTPKPFKSIFQARYEPKLRFYDLMMETAGQFSEYPHWRTNRLDVTLRDQEKHCSLSLKFDSFTYTQDSGNLELEKERMEKAVNDLPAALELDGFKRLGFLRRYLLPVNMGFEELVSIMNVKLFSQDSRLQGILPPELEDVMYRIDSADDDHQYHITVGPVRGGQIPQLLSFNKEDHLAAENAIESLQAIESAYPDVAIFFDIDFYRSGEIPTEDTLSFIQNGRDSVHELVSNLGEYLLSTKVEE